MKLPYLFFLAFLSAFTHLHAQCGVSIAPIPTLCRAYGTYQLHATPAGGTWSGAAVSPSGLIQLNNLTPGTFPATYSYTDSSCTETQTAQFTVGNEPSLQVQVQGSFNCATSQPVPITIVSSGNLVSYSGPGGSGAVVGGMQTISVTKPGVYRFETFDVFIFCSRVIEVTVPSINALPVQAMDCSNCAGMFTSLCVDTVPPGSEVRWLKNNSVYIPLQLPFSPIEAGVWTVRVTQPNGCISTDDILVPAIGMPTPNLSAGTDITIQCQDTALLVGSATPGSHITTQWSTTDGHIIGSPALFIIPIDEPGQYVLTATNTFTGCFRRDTAVAYPDLTTFPSSGIVATICEGDTLEGYTQSGVYLTRYETGAACDSFHLVDLTVLVSASDTLSGIICAGETLLGYTAAGLYRDTFVAFNGCDSIRVLDLSVLPTVETSLSATICAGEMFLDYTAGGTYRDTFSTVNGCDSVRVLTLTVLPTFQTDLDITICAGESYQGFTETGTYTLNLTAGNGCDSIHVINLVVTPPIVTTFNATLCADGINQTGTTFTLLSSMNGCDSLVVFSLLVLDSLLLDSVIVSADDGSGTGSIITVIATGGLPPYQFLWSTGATTWALTGLPFGAYTLTLTDAFGCSSVLVFTVSLVLNAAAVAAPFQLSVFPNPAEAGEAFWLRMETETSESFRLRIFDAAGRTVREHGATTLLAGAAIAVRLDAPGLYWLHLQDVQGRSVVRAVVVQ